MKIYPVTIASDEMEIKVKPFTSLTEARKYRKKKEDDGFHATVLPYEEFSLNKDGLLAAFRRGQHILKWEM